MDSGGIDPKFWDVKRTPNFFHQRVTISWGIRVRIGFCHRFSLIGSWLCQPFGSTSHLPWPPWISRPSTTYDVMVSRHEMTCQETQALVNWQRPKSSRSSNIALLRSMQTRFLFHSHKTRKQRHNASNPFHQNRVGTWIKSKKPAMKTQGVVIGATQAHPVPHVPFTPLFGQRQITTAAKRCFTMPRTSQRCPTGSIGKQQPVERLYKGRIFLERKETHQPRKALAKSSGDTTTQHVFTGNRRYPEKICVSWVVRSRPVSWLLVAQWWLPTPAITDANMITSIMLNMRPARVLVDLPFYPLGGPSLVVSFFFWFVD